MEFKVELGFAASLTQGVRTIDHYENKPTILNPFGVHLGGSYDENNEDWD